MHRVDVLDECDLVACGAALTGDDGAVGEEELPDAEPTSAVFGGDGVAVRHPVTVPAPDCGGVVDACERLSISNSLGGSFG